MITKNSFKNVRRAVIFQLLCLMVAINYFLCQNNKVVWSSSNMGFAESNSSDTKVKTVAGQSFVSTKKLMLIK